MFPKNAHPWKEVIPVEKRLPRKLAAMLYADVAGYSRLTGEDEDVTHPLANFYDARMVLLHARPL
jgi:class 3 adenylate cyclase